MKRWSLVRGMKVNSVSLASIFQIGDNDRIEPVSMELAFREGDQSSFKFGEENFEDYPLFTREIPVPQNTEPVLMTIDNSHSRIQVGQVDITAVLFSSVMQAGSNLKMKTEARIKHIRHVGSNSAGQSLDSGPVSSE
jgi:spore germination protein PE